MSSEIRFDPEKQIAAHAAVEFVRDGMTVGLGTGSTAAYAIAALGWMVAGGLSIRGVATSESTRRIAVDAGIELTDLDSSPRLDITIDGADRFDDELNLIKGGGGALLREKIVAAASQRVVIIADSSKRSNPLGGFPVPVEVVRFALRPVTELLQDRGLNPRLRQTASGELFVTDEGNVIIDLVVETIPSPAALSAALDPIPGVVCHGLFLNLASEVLMGSGNDVVRFTRG